MRFERIIWITNMGTRDGIDTAMDGCEVRGSTTLSANNTGGECI
jgi:hypothetical protein